MAIVHPRKPSGRAVVGLLCGLVLGLSALAPASARAGEIITLPEAPPQRVDGEPTGRLLIESWLGGSDWPAGTLFADRRYEVLDVRPSPGPGRFAYLHVRLLDLEGNALAFAAKTCPGRETPIELQLYFQWSKYISAWVALAERGGDAFNLCEGPALWTKEQVELVVNPPPRPKPPKVSLKDVTTPKPGSTERKAILDGIRPAFEAVFGAPIEFKVNEMRVAAGFAYLLVHPQRPGGKQLSTADWEKGGGPCEGSDASAMLFAHKMRGTWEIGWGTPEGVCATDSLAGMGWVIGAPAALIGEQTWGDEDEMLPVYDNQYFDLWWLKR